MCLVIRLAKYINFSPEAFKCVVHLVLHVHVSMYMFQLGSTNKGIQEKVTVACYIDVESDIQTTDATHTCQVTCFRRVTPGNRACHPHFPEHPSGHGFHYDDPESPEIGPDIININLFGKYRDFTYRKDNNPNGQLQSTTIYLRGK